MIFDCCVNSTNVNRLSWLNEWMTNFKRLLSSCVKTDTKDNINYKNTFLWKTLYSSSTTFPLLFLALLWFSPYFSGHRFSKDVPTVSSIPNHEIQMKVTSRNIIYIVQYIQNSSAYMRITMASYGFFMLCCCGMEGMYPGRGSSVDGESVYKFVYKFI